MRPSRDLPKEPLTTSGPFVYRLGRQVFNLERGVQFPYGLPLPLLHIQKTRTGSDGFCAYSETVCFVENPQIWLKSVMNEA